MTVASKYNHISQFPRYKVEYTAYKDMALEHVYTISWLGSYQSKFGVQPYVDIAPVLEDDPYKRVRLPKWTLTDIDTMAHDPEAMKDISEGKVGVKFHALHTDNGDTITLEWFDL